MLATTRGALLRGTTEDALGDEVDNNTTPLAEVDWNSSRTNFMPNVDMDRLSTVGWVTTTASANATSDLVLGQEGQPARRIGVASIVATPWTIATYGARSRAEMPLGALGDVWTLGIRARASKPCLATMSLGYGGGSSTTGPVAQLSLGPDEADFFADFPVGAAAVGQRLNMRIAFQRTSQINTDLTVADWIEISRPLFTPEWADPRFFRGDDGESLLERYSWAGPAGVSASILETGILLGDWSDFPLSLIERETREQDPASNTWRTVRYFAGRVPADVPVDEGDRIRDNRDGKIYAVDSIRREPRSLSGRSSVSLKLRRTAP